MLQYIPKNWPYDHAHPSEKGDRTGADKALFCFIIFKQPNVARSSIGCFKARQMAKFWQRRMNAYA